MSDESRRRVTVYGPGTNVEGSEVKNRDIYMFVWLSAALLVVGLQGCSLFSEKEDSVPDSTSFRATVSVPGAMSAPVPVEVAHDINHVGKDVPRSESGWRSSAPDDDSGRVALSPVESSVIDGEAERQPASGSSDAQNERTPYRERAIKNSRGGATEQYRVKTGDTLMKISFEKFGDIYRWHEIYETNRSLIKNVNSLTPGMILAINGVEYVVIEKNGVPYLIKRNDTLIRISRNLYGAPAYWKKLWHNNRQLIRDPNKIYAGFTLYFQGIERDKSLPLANEEREPSKQEVGLPTRLPAKQK